MSSNWELVLESMNTFAQAVNSNMDELPASHFMDAADGVSILDPSIHCNQINVDWLFNR